MDIPLVSKKKEWVFSHSAHNISSLPGKIKGISRPNAQKGGHPSATIPLATVREEEVRCTVCTESASKDPFFPDAERDRLPCEHHGQVETTASGWGSSVIDPPGKPPEDFLTHGIACS
jgi:hypothetical protein